MRKTTTCCITFSDTKIAALTHDYVMPLILEEIVEGYEDFNPMPYIVPPPLIDTGGVNGVRDDMQRHFANYFIFLMYRVQILRGSKTALEELESTEEFRRLQKKFDEMTSHFFSILSDIDLTPDSFVGLPPSTAGQDNIERTGLIIESLRLVDASKLTWEQVVEFRKDQSSQAKFRNFKTFLDSSISGMSKAQVEDLIGARMFEYNQVLDDWGIETKSGSWEIFFNAKSSAALVASGLATVLGVVPTTAGIATTSGLAVATIYTLGNVKISINRRKRALNNFKLSSPISYLVDVNEASKSAAEKSS